MVKKQTYIPVSNIVPLVFREGASLLELIHGLAKYVQDTLEPSLKHVVDGVVAEVESQMDQAKANYVVGVQEFQRIHDRFMDDVEASLTALNDTVVSDLVKDGSSMLGETIREIFKDVDNDKAVADFINTDDSGVRGALNRIYTHNTFTPEYTNIYFGLDSDTTSGDNLQAALDELPPYSSFTMPRGHIIEVTTPVTITKPLTIRGGTFHCSETSALRVEASDVTLDNITVRGDGVHHRNRPGYYGVQFIGSLDHPIERVEAKNLHIYDIPGTCLSMQYTKNFVVESCHIHDYTYCAVTVHSGASGLITKNTTERCIVNGNPNNNSYGIAVTDTRNTDDARSRDITVSHNTVKDVPMWEGLDTHGGVNIRFLYNTVIGCKNGIVLTLGASTRKFSPQQCQVIGNIVDGDGLSSTNGIMIGGWREGNSNTPTYADAVIALNRTVDVSRPINYYPFVENPSEYVSRTKTLAFGNVDSRVGHFNSFATTGWVSASELGSSFSGWDISNLKARVTEELSHHRVEVVGSVRSTTGNPDQRIIHMDGNTTSPYEGLQLPPSIDNSGVHAMDVTSSGILRKTVRGSVDGPMRISATWYSRPH